MIKSKEDLNSYIAADLAVSYVPKNSFKRWLHLLGGNEQCAAFRYVRRLRLTEYYLNTGKIVRYHWSHLLLGRMGLKYSIRIRPNSCDKGLCIIHLAGGGGIFVNAESIGQNSRFQAGVVIGNKGGDNYRPTIGNHVHFGLGCKVYGKITIGDNVSILPNAVVTHDVPANAIVGGIPAKIIKFKE